MKLKSKFNCNAKKVVGDTFLVVMVSAVFVYVISCFANWGMDSDTFFLIATGKHIVANGNVPTINPFIIHEGFGIIVQQWLFDVSMFFLYDTWGIWGIYWYSVVALLIAMIAMYKFIGLYTESVDIKMLCVALFAFTWGEFFVARPTSISFTLCLMWIVVLERYRITKKPTILLWAVPISLLMINVHAAMWPMLFILSLPFIVPKSLIDTIASLISCQHGPTQNCCKNKKNVFGHIKLWANENKWLLFALFSMLLVGFINPNGVLGMAYVLLSYGEASSGIQISELQPPILLSVWGIIIVATIVLFVIYVIRFRNKSNIAIIYMTLGTIVLASTHMRNSWFLCFSVLPLIANLLTDMLSQSSETMSTKQTISKIPLVISVIAVIISVTIIHPNEIEDGRLSPVKAAEYLNNKDRDSIVLFTEFDNGAYMEFNGYQVYIDARPELFQKKINGKENVYTEYSNLVDGTGNANEFIKKYNFTHMIVEDGSFLAGYMEINPDFEMVVDGNSYKVYESVNYCK